MSNPAAVSLRAANGAPVSGSHCCASCTYPRADTALPHCCRFAPHFHPGAAEYFLGIRGKTNLVAYINSKLVRLSCCRILNLSSCGVLSRPKQRPSTAAPELQPAETLHASAVKSGVLTRFPVAAAQVKNEILASGVDSVIVPINTVRHRTLSPHQLILRIRTLA